MKKFTFIDLFCGIGGFHQAMTALGGECVFASDIDPVCRETYKINYNIEPAGDITKINAADIPPHDVLCGGFPCQAFSKAGARQGFQNPTSGTLFFEILRILHYHHPPHVLLENVRNLVTHDNGNTWRVIHDSLQDAGYNLYEKPTIFSPHYLGIPQHRERVMIMCVRKDIGTLPKITFPTHEIPTCNIEDILLNGNEIPNLQKYQLSAGQIQLIDCWNDFLQGIQCEKIPTFPIWTNCFRPLDDILRDESIETMLRWKRNIVLKNNQLWEGNKAFISDWLSHTKKCKLFVGTKAKLEWQAGPTSYSNIWNHLIQFRPSGLRIKPATYAPALVAIVQTTIVGSRKRFLTPRECARLQSFPDSFILSQKDGQAYKQLGNAVNVEVVKLFARFLMGEGTKGKGI